MVDTTKSSYTLTFVEENGFPDPKSRKQHLGSALCTKFRTILAAFS